MRKIAIILLFTRVFRGERKPGKLVPDDFEVAKVFLLRQGQSETFPEEIGVMSKTFEPLA